MRRALPLRLLLALPRATPAEGWVSASGGVYVPAGSVGGTSWNTVGTGSLQGGYDLGPVGASLSLGLLSTTAGPRLSDTAWPLVLRVRGRLPLGAVAPYAFGGVGIAFTRAILSAVPYDSTAFAGQAGAGVELTLNDLLFLGLEATWTWLRPQYAFGPLDLSGFTAQLALGLRL